MHFVLILSEHITIISSEEVQCDSTLFFRKYRQKLELLLIHLFNYYSLIQNGFWRCLEYFFLSNHSQKNRKDSLEALAVPLKFSLELEISGVAVQSIHQNSEKWWLLGGIAKWKRLWGCFSHFLLLWPWCQDVWGSSEECYISKTISQIFFVCYNLLNSQNIPIN